ncbi:MAG: polysaccharide deacetylase family protein [Flavobacteriaceae bacterium]|nr:polysaccharide deacetylase family protein [Flavobacteriaceae bacterium]
MKQIFRGILGIQIGFTTKVEDFIKHQGPKITYSKQALQSEFHIRSHHLLFEQGISDIDIPIEDWDGVVAFFAAGEQSALAYDIFAASFYLLSRYEEYLPHVKDPHGRYPFSESIAVQHGFIERPIIDIWAYRLLEKLQQKFPDLEAELPSFSYQSIMDVTTSHAYAYRGAIRTIYGLARDIGNLNFASVRMRFGVLLGLQKDPYNNFMELIRLHQKCHIDSHFFFQMADYARYDKNISIHHNKFRYLIKAISDYSKVSLIASYQALENTKCLWKEKKRLRNLIHRPVKAVRLRYNKIHIPYTYRELVEAEFSSDYSMGYTHKIGFRAGTCSTFYFYDINNEQQLPIKIRPFAIQDYALLAYSKEEALEKIQKIQREVAAVNGRLITVFTNANLGKPQTKYLKEVYHTFIQKLWTEKT